MTTINHKYEFADRNSTITSSLIGLVTYACLNFGPACQVASKITNTDFLYICDCIITPLVFQDEQISKRCKTNCYILAAWSLNYGSRTQVKSQAKSEGGHVLHKKPDLKKNGFHILFGAKNNKLVIQKNLIYEKSLQLCFETISPWKSCKLAHLHLCINWDCLK